MANNHHSKRKKWILLAIGGVILVGDHFAWSSREPAVAGTKLNIVAKNLGPIAM